MPLGPEIVGKGVVLRGLTTADVSPAYVDWLNDPVVNRYLETRHKPQTAAAVADFVAVKAASADEYLFGIFLGDGRRHVGNIKLGPQRAIHRIAEISLLIGARDVWGRGLGSAAIESVSRFGFGSLGLRKLTASIYGGNVASLRAFERAGWRREATLPQHYMLDGAPIDIVVMGLLS